MNPKLGIKPLTKTIQIPSNLISNSSHQVQRIRPPTQSSMPSNGSPRLSMPSGVISPYLIFLQRKRDQIAKDYPQLNG